MSMLSVWGEKVTCGLRSLMPTAGGGQAGSGAGDVTRIGITPDLDPMWFSLGDLE